MFLINPGFSLVAVVLVFALYLFLARRAQVGQTTDDIRSGLFITVAEWASGKAITMPSAPERAWRPSLLVPVSSASEINGSYRFLRALTRPQGSVTSLGICAPGQEESLGELQLFTSAFIKDGIRAQTTILEDDSFVNGVRAATQVLRRTFFRPNLLFLHLRDENNVRELRQLIDKTAAYRMGIVLLARHPVNDLGREQVINVWISPPPEWEFNARAGSNDLALLLALQLQRNWAGRINLCMAIAEERDRPQAEQLLADLTTQARLASNTGTIILQSSFEAALAQAERADLSVIGLPQKPDLAQFRNMMKIANGSCVFVRDSGDESALA